jgi:hypothetical protein
MKIYYIGGKTPPIPAQTCTPRKGSTTLPASTFLPLGMSTLLKCKWKNNQKLNTQTGKKKKKHHMH